MNTEMSPMTREQAEGGHCTRGGSISSGAAVCQCGAWSAADVAPADRQASRREHLALVVKMRDAAR